MSRSTQIMGLSDRAREFLKCNVESVPFETCPECGTRRQSRAFLTALKLEGLEVEGGSMISVVYDRETGVNEGMFEDGPVLHKYRLKTGKWVKEIVQASPWSSGPCIFLCLQDEDGRRLGEWSDDEIKTA